ARPGLGEAHHFEGGIAELEIDQIERPLRRLRNAQPLALAKAERADIESDGALGRRGQQLDVVDPLEHAQVRPALARFAASRSRLFAVSTTKRTCLPRPHCSIGSRTENSNVTLRRSTSTIFASMVTWSPSGVAARWSIETWAPTESSPGSRCCNRKSRQAYSTSLTMRGVAWTMPSFPMKPMKRDS